MNEDSFPTNNENEHVSDDSISDVSNAAPKKETACAELPADLDVFEKMDESEVLTIRPNSARNMIRGMTILLLPMNIDF